MALFIVGAGTTRGASFVNPKRFACVPPLDRDFFTQLQRIANPKHQTLVSEVMKDAVQLFGTNFDATMETVFTTLEHTIRMVKATGERKDFEQSDLQNKRDRLEQAIAAVLEESLMRKRGNTSSLKPKRCRLHQKFVSSILQPKDTIIGFNYDCLLDLSLKYRGNRKWNAHYGYGFNLGARGRALSGDDFWQPNTPASQADTVHYYKLHGSLHFQIEEPEESASCVRLKERPYTKTAGDGLKFTIIPPESHKDYDKGVFGTLWSKASDAIYKAEHIVVVGYSLPLTDLHSTTLFRTSVRGGKLKSLVVVNPDRDARKRIRSVFQRGFGASTRVLSFDFFPEFLTANRTLWER